MPAALWLATALLVVGAVAALVTLTRTRLTLVRASLWAIVCVVPPAAMAFSGNLGGYPVIDHGGALVVVAVGAALAVVARPLPPASTGSGVLRVVAGGVALSVTVWQIFTELAMGAVTQTIVANTLLASLAGALAWTLVSFVIHRRNLAASVAAGAIAGAGASFAGVTALPTVTLVIVAMLAAVVGALVARTGSLSRLVTGSVVVPGWAGLVAVGVAGERVGAIYTGQPVHLAVQLLLATVAIGWGVATAVLFRLGTLRTAAPPAPRTDGA